MKSEMRNQMRNEMKNEMKMNYEMKNLPFSFNLWFERSLRSFRQFQISRSAGCSRLFNNT